MTGFMDVLKKRLEEIALPRAGPPMSPGQPVGGTKDMFSKVAAPTVPDPAPMSVGFSPDQMEDYVGQYGGVQGLMEKVQSAREGEQSADPNLSALSKEDLAALDRYTTFAQMGEQGASPVEKVGGVLNMGLTEGVKMVPGAQDLLSALYEKYSGGKPGDPKFFGGANTSKANLGNIVASIYGAMR